MTTRPVTSITDEQLAEIEMAATDSKLNIYRPFGWAHSVRCGNHLQTDFDYLSLIEPATILALITRLRAAEADVLRFKEIAEQANVNCRNTAYYLSKYRKDLSGICSGWCEAIKKEMERHP